MRFKTILLTYGKWFIFALLSRIKSQLMSLKLIFGFKIFLLRLLDPNYDQYIDYNINTYNIISYSITYLFDHILFIIISGSFNLFPLVHHSISQLFAIVYNKILIQKKVMQDLFICLFIFLIYSSTKFVSIDEI